ncbi:protein SPMIP2 [Meriones unguiculatus]|uniref:protein SPMIP2 n=1 Tax=Meriones unguiculatus TaxID=10047 RepID=UPI000B4F315D|nr:protein SPMIP2 [Meriones unguiculatus]
MALSYRDPLSDTVGKRMIVSAQDPESVISQTCGQNFSSQYGPDYIKDHLPRVHQHSTYIGEKRPALEKTGDLSYLCRPAPNRSLPARYKHEYAGGIGWGIPEFSCINRSNLESGLQLKHGELSLYAVDKLTHRYQNPWQPKPSVLDQQGQHSRGFLAWTISDFEHISQRHCRTAILVKQSKQRATLSSKLPRLPRKEEKVRALAAYVIPGKATL